MLERLHNFLVSLLLLLLLFISFLLLFCFRCPLLHIYYKMFPPTGKTPISLRGDDSMECVIWGMTQANASERWPHTQPAEMLPSSGWISAGHNFGPALFKKEISTLVRRHFFVCAWTVWMQQPLCKDTLTCVHQMILVIMPVILHDLCDHRPCPREPLLNSSKHPWIAFIISQQEDYTSLVLMWITFHRWRRGILYKHLSNRHCTILTKHINTAD